MARIPHLLTLVLAAAFSVPSGLEAQSAPPPVEEILARHVEAIGGFEAWREIDTLRMTGVLEVGESRAPLVVEYRRPGKIRITFDLQGLEAVRAWDGEKGWVRMPMLGHEEPVPMEADEAAAVAKLADFEGPFVDWKAKGLEVELAGRDEVGGRPVWALGVSFPDGFEMVSFIDAETWLEVKQLFAATADGQDLTISTLREDHRRVGGVVYPHLQTTSIEGSPNPPQVMRFEKIEIDPGIPAERFFAD